LTVASGFKDRGVKVGETVELSWKVANDRHQAESVQIVK